MSYRLGLAAVVGLALLGLGFYGVQAARQAGGFGFPLDDSWIHLQIARNLASGQGWSFNPGEPTGGATSPLWILFIAPLFYLGGDVTIWVKALGAVLFIANVLLVADVARLATGDRRVGLAAGALAALQPALIWTAFSGMETTLYLLLFLLSLRSLILVERRGRRSAYASTAWLALAGWARPELWALLPLLWTYLFWRRRELAAGRWWVHGGIALLAIGGFAAFNMALWNHPAPATLAAKQAHLDGSSQGGLARALLARVSRWFAGIDLLLRSQNIVLLTCLAGVLLLAQRRPEVSKRLLYLVGVIAIGIAVLALVNVGAVSFQTYRRAAHMLVSMDVLVAAGCVAVWDLLRRRAPAPDTSLASPENTAPRPWLRPGSERWRDVVLICLAATALVIQAQAVRTWGSRYANDVRSINQADVAAGLWLAANTPAGALVAANDVGAIAYFSRQPIFDMIGLTSPESIDVLRRTPYLSEERDRQMKDLLLAQQVDYVAIFPAWFPWLAQDPMLHEVQRITVRSPSALGAADVVIYQVRDP
jgi:hypothetical protein